MKNFKKIFDDIVFGFLLVIYFLFLLTIISVFSGYIMNMFGFEYDSFGVMILFFLIIKILNYPIGVVIDYFCLYLIHREYLGIFGAKVVNALISTTPNILSIVAVDYFMKGISVEPVANLVISVIWSMIGVRSINKKYHHDGLFDDLDDN